MSTLFRTFLSYIFLDFMDRVNYHRLYKKKRE
nr:MAG TPA: hypothetical protein [Caudoviricetes sp.]